MTPLPTQEVIQNFHRARRALLLRSHTKALLLWTQLLSLSWILSFCRLTDSANSKKIMPIAYTIQDPFHWEALSSSAMSEPRRNSLLAARRNSLFSGTISLFDFTMYPPVVRTEQEEMDPFAPLSFDDGLHGAKPLSADVPRSRPSTYVRSLTDRSESSSDTSPSLTSSPTGSSQASHPVEHPQCQGTQGGYLQGNHVRHQEHLDHTPYHALASNAAVLSTTAFSSKTEDTPLGHEDEDEDGQRFKRFHEEKWSHRFKELLQFHREFGHSAVPHTYPRNPQLARWVKRQRRQYKLRRDGRPSTMTLERLQLLDSVGFVWDSHDVNWREKLSALDAFRHDHGHCNVPSNYSDKKLATWVKCQRRQYKLHVDKKASAMTEERIHELARRGFEWEIRSTACKQKVVESSDH